MEEHLIPLTDVGFQQARALADRLDLAASHVIVSNLLRTQQTAAPYCARYGIVPEVQPLLREMNVLDIELIRGLTGEERRPIGIAYWDESDPNSRKGKNAETFAEFGRRVDAFRQNLLPALTHNTICFGHGLWMGMLIWRLMGFGFKTPSEMSAFHHFQVALPLPNCAVYELRTFDQENWSVHQHFIVCSII